MDRKKLTQYLLTTFAITYTAWWGLALLTQRGILCASDALFTLFHVLGGFGPTIAAIAVLSNRTPKGVWSFVFSREKRSFRYLLLFCAMQGLVVGLSSRELNPQLPWFVAPIVLLSATFVGGGNEELGWRGILQPELEKKLPFPVATLLTGSIWMLWHVPLWFVVGASQQSMNFGLYCIYGLILSFWLATLHKRTKSVWFCAIFHGFSNLMLSMFLIKVNWILVVGLLASLGFSIWLYGKSPEDAESLQ